MKVQIILWYLSTRDINHSTPIAQIKNSTLEIFPTLPSTTKVRAHVKALATTTADILMQKFFVLLVFCFVCVIYNNNIFFFEVLEYPTQQLESYHHHESVRRKFFIHGVFSFQKVACCMKMLFQKR